MARPRVVIVGGGFGGLACARALNRRPVDVTLLDERNYHLFTPLLYQVGTALLNPSAIAYPLRMRFRRSPTIRYRQARVASVDLQGRTVKLADGDTLPYDYLVLATGSANNYFGNEDLARATLGVKTLEEALRLRNHLLTCLERAEAETDLAERRPWLTFVIVGGGPTGVEYAGALQELLKLVLVRDYKGIAMEEARIILVEGLDRLLTAFPESLGRYAERTLVKRGIQVRTNVLVAEATDRQVRLSDHSVIDARTVVWSAGVRPEAPTANPDPERSRSKRFVVDEHLRIPGAPGAFAIGDVAAARDQGAELPGLSPVAMQEGRHVSRAILNELRAKPRDLKPFHYVDKGTLATIGRNAAVGTIRNLKLKGFIGWLAWLGIHIYYLIGFRNRIAALAAWGWNYVKRDRPIRIITRADTDPLVEEI